MIVLMGTRNPGKIEGARQAFERYFDDVEVEGIAVASDVGDQPVNEEINIRFLRSGLYFNLIIIFRKAK